MLSAVTDIQLSQYHKESYYYLLLSLKEIKAELAG